MIDLIMLEGAKSMGAGAATIASAGAAIGIGNVFSSLIHSVARNPSLAKQLFGYAIKALLVTAFLCVFFLVAKGVGALSLFYTYLTKSGLSVLVHVFVKSAGTGLKGVGLLFLGTILRCYFSPSSMIEPSGSDLPDLNAPAPEPEATVEENKLGGSDSA